MVEERYIVSALRQLAGNRGIEFDSYSQDWIIRLRRRGVTRWVFGYDFDINSCCAQMLCKDKAGASLLLELAGVPRVEHVLFNHPQNRSFVPDSGTWSEIHAYAQRCGFEVVCKPNEGSGGGEVMRVASLPELEEAVHRLFARARAIAISPYLQISDEYRVVVLQGKCLLTYRKLRPTLVGDGRSTRFDLFARQFGGKVDPKSVSKALIELGRQQCDLSLVVPAGELWRINWKHNLGLGAGVELLGESFPRYQALQRLAVQAADALNLQFGSVDVVETSADGPLQVLESNAGVMMESFVRLAPDGAKIASGIYGAALDAMFAR